jgi:hypothetical protein
MSVRVENRGPLHKWLEEMQRLQSGKGVGEEGEQTPPKESLKDEDEETSYFVREEVVKSPRIE